MELVLSTHVGAEKIRATMRAECRMQYVPVPDDMTTAAYAGGYYGSEQTGYFTKRWNSAVEERYRALLVALGKVFNDRPEFEGIKTAETAIMWQYEEYDPEGYVRQLYAMIDT